ncbi:hypothetical protein SAMN02745146_3623 [Hymenobacter daecheongensis DSM 21074]|uniref:Uncharacterized protein n=1 Tax=Hymenobacter daecheongensis DSM 21074 TaxID=1121955 RepID=A0A1M6L4Y6_9BACT|nr:hypothetical protein SAMN02745146_3623 [Hymenobacter daecheongensis DSM 21074]
MSFFIFSGLLVAAALLVTNTFGTMKKTLQPVPVRVRNNR